MALAGGDEVDEVDDVVKVVSSVNDRGLGSRTYVGRAKCGGLVVSDDDSSSNGGRCITGLSGTGIGATCVPVDASPIVRVSTGEFESPFDTINSTRPPTSPQIQYRVTNI